jgi:tetratricopeptide (TPR) repeat protein
MFAVRILGQGLLMIIVVVSCGAISSAQPGQVNPGRSGSQRPSNSQNKFTIEGIAAFNRGEKTQARNWFEQALKANPNDAEAHKYLGILDDLDGNLTNAEIHFRAAARLAPNSASARNNYGAVLLKLERMSEAAREFEASLRLDARQSNALINLAQIRYRENTPASLQSSYELFERAAALEPDSTIERSLVVIALRLKNKPSAARHYALYAAQASSMDAANRLELGGALYEAGLLNEAETELQAVLASDPANGAAVVLLGRVYLARGDHKAAGVLLETAVAKNQATAAIYSLLAVVYEKVGRYENAIPAMRLAINLQPDSENYRFQYGLLLTNADAPAAAVIRLDEALKVFPRSPRLWLARGIAELKDNKNIEAIGSIGKAIELDAKFAQAYAYLGLVRAQTGDYAGAVTAYEQALATDPGLGVVHQLIADAMLQQTDSDSGRIEAELKKAISLAPDYIPAQLTLGKLYVRTQRWNEAAAALNEVVRRRPETAEAYYQLGRVYARLKMKKEADAALAKFKELSESQKTKSETELREAVRRLADVKF